MFEFWLNFEQLKQASRPTIKTYARTLLFKPWKRSFLVLLLKNLTISFKTKKQDHFMQDQKSKKASVLKLPIWNKLAWKTASTYPGDFLCNLKFVISYISWFSDLKFFISDLDKCLQISDLKFGSGMENFRSKINLKNKFSDLKLDLKNPLLNYNLCISSKTWSFFFWCFCNTKICLGWLAVRKTSK